jgi:hypothetical protein
LEGHRSLDFDTLCYSIGARSGDYRQESVKVLVYLLETMPTFEKAACANAEYNPETAFAVKSSVKVPGT